MATKKANGSGTIRKRADGRWEGKYSLVYDPKIGKLIRKSVYGKTQKEVRLALSKIVSEMDSGTYAEPSKMKVSQWLDEWLAGYTMNIKTATRSAYEEHIRVHIKPSLGNARCFTYSLILKLHFWDSTVILFFSWSVTQNAIRFSFFINQLLVFSLPGDWGSPQRWGTCGTQVPCLLHYRTASALHR